MPTAKQYDWICRICARTSKWPERQRSKPQEKLSDASTILFSGQPAHAQNHGACLQQRNVFIKTPHSLSDVLPTAAPQECPGTSLNPVSSSHSSCSPWWFEFSGGRQFPSDFPSNSRKQGRLTRRVRTKSTKPASFQGWSNFCNCLTGPETLCQCPTLQAGISL